MTRAFMALALVLTLLTGCKTAHNTSGYGWPRHILRAEQITSLNLPRGEAFDASGLWLLDSGELLTQRNAHDSLLYRIDFLPGSKEANLTPYNDCFTREKLRSLAIDDKGFDCEGIARDSQGRFYLCEERRRWIFRCDPATDVTDRLDIDWTPVKDYFSTVEPNASFEGIAIGNGILYVANERSSPLIIEVDLKTSRVRKSFVVQPRKSSFLGLHYSDLCWFEDHLWALCRQHRVILKVDPKSRNVVAEYDYADIESNLGYRTGLPVGLMEGLTVSKDSIWIVTDNNSDPRGRTGNDKRPTLVRCPRPD
jgi:Esterase-like activity of phytase